MPFILQIALFHFILVLLQILASSPASAQEEPPPSSSASQQQTSNQDLFNAPVQSITFPSSKPIRHFSGPGDSPAPPLPVPAHFAPPVTDGNFGNLVTILNYKDQFNKDDAEALLDGHGDLRVLTSCYLPEKQRSPNDTLRIVPEPKDKVRFRENYESIGIGNYKALDPDTISEQVLGMAIKEGLDIGADIMLFQEGASLVHSAKGYSIGFLNSFSFVNSGAETTGRGNVAVGGIGYGKGESSYASKPWLRVQFFRKRPTPISTTPAEPPRQDSPQNQKQPEPSDKDGRGPTPEEIYIIEQDSPRSNLGDQEPQGKAGGLGKTSPPKDAGDKHKQDSVFNAIEDQMNDAEKEVELDYLLNYDLSGAQ